MMKTQMIPDLDTTGNDLLYIALERLNKVRILCVCVSSKLVSPAVFCYSDCAELGFRGFDA